ncbi:diversity-generating retroelement protein Avd [Patescibacteria group bacterium]|nr:diversity-generating retroelement protein Avd [Patescibacteria group bacterium]MBU1472794.1 diversity-generating retroelement protein Avd [Patescibacteria group bacterium]
MSASYDKIALICQSHTHTPIVDFGPDIPIFTKLYALYRELAITLPSFPKTQRYSLGARLENTVLDILEFLFLVPTSPEKFNILQMMSVKVDLLKVLLRLAKDTQALSSARYLVLQEMLQEIGKMLGGWIRAAKVQNEMS